MKQLPNPYADIHNTKRIKAWQDLAKEYNIDEQTVARIFNKGVDFYKELIEESVDLAGREVVLITSSHQHKLNNNLY